MQPNAFSTGRAHECSAFSIIDPIYSVSRLAPEPDIADAGSADWFYGDAELECWQLDQTVNRGFAAARNVHYARNYHRASKCGVFRFLLSSPSAELSEVLHFRAVGSIRVRLGKETVYQSVAGDAIHTVNIVAQPDWGAEFLEIALSTEDEPTAILILAPGDDLLMRPDAWSWSSDGCNWTSVSTFAQTRSGVAPHKVEEPTVLLKPMPMDRDSLFDFGREIFGRVHLAVEGCPRLFAGESVAEALEEDDSKFEQNLNLDPAPDGGWITRHQVGLRYLKLDSASPIDSSAITCYASFHPVCYRGAFACSDERLTRIWMYSAYTLRLCMQRFVLDGVKRDRMPWVGDQALNLISNAYTFADASIIKRSFTALGRLDPSDGDINGIVDYTLWWIINNDVYQRHFNDPAYLRKEWPRIRKRIESIADRCDAAGFLSARPNEWVFIDWGNERDPGRILTPLQILWYWAQKSAVALALRVDDCIWAERWKGSVEALGREITRIGWDTAKQAWRHYLDEKSVAGRIANVLAVLSDLATTDQWDGIRAVLVSSETQSPNTPFMTAFELMALSRIGIDVRSRMITCWGAMLDKGATTFWEECVPDSPLYAMYERPFGKSLCHAWSSGPAVLLPADILGIRPLDDGWRVFSFAPRLGSLEWANATVPTPYGNIEAFASADEVTLVVPEGAAAKWNGETIAGPRVVSSCMIKPSF